MSSLRFSNSQPNEFLTIESRLVSFYALICIWPHAILLAISIRFEESMMKTENVNASGIFDSAIRRILNTIRANNRDLLLDLPILI